ncbi:hypothetical protein G3I38_31970 [Streptomyces sp. SID7958]|uniref:Uncharacterized protein n=2 Tax=unclassified Streptomyces TaxID=2593676 RepID=A0A6G3QRG4_9ACTN|nr:MULTISPECIES: hypothetical protein [unclassified Streptomyces]NEA86083.1 hypothetical protein [Streptomyces sp. SID14436]NEC83735.1 hypothetical protein [Streptomyces sp. SID7958]
MCPRSEDFHRTVTLLGDLALYAHTYGADLDFVNEVGPCLAVSLPEPPPGIFPPGYDPTDGPQYPGGQS